MPPVRLLTRLATDLRAAKGHAGIRLATQTMQGRLRSAETQLKLADLTPVTGPRPAIAQARVLGRIVLIGRPDQMRTSRIARIAVLPMLTVARIGNGACRSARFLEELAPAPAVEKPQSRRVQMHLRVRMRRAELGRRQKKLRPKRNSRLNRPVHTSD